MIVKRLATVALFLCFCVAVGVWYFVFVRATPDGGRSGQQRQPPLAQVEAVRQASIALTLELPGEVRATNRVTVSSMKEGRIDYCPWREGDLVQTGETLLSIDREVHRAEAQAAQAALELAQARLDDLLAGARPEEIRKARAHLERSEAMREEAQQGFRRQEALSQRNVTSQEAFDKARERLAVAEADVIAAQNTLEIAEAGPTETQISVQKATVNEAAARLELARAHLAECVIAASFDGIVSQVHVRPGDVAQPRAPLMEIYDPASLVIRFAVPEAHAAAVHPGMRLKGTLDAAPDSNLSATIVRVYPELDPVMRTRAIEAQIDEATAIAPNMFARVALTVAEDPDAHIVPAEAVLVTPTGDKMLYVIEDDQAVRRVITTGIEDGRHVQILSGVAVGEQVAVAGNASLQPGMAVRVASGPGGGRPGGDGQPQSQRGARP